MDQNLDGTPRPPRVDPIARRTRLFRLTLGIGAASSIAIGLWGVFWTRMLESVLGLVVPASVAGFDALGRMYGGVMLVLGLGYALSAAQPHRSRSLLAMLFAAPLITGAVVIAGAARGEIRGWHGAIFATYNIAYCLFFFRTYPRVEQAVPEPTIAEPPMSGEDQET